MSTPAGWYDDGSGRQRWWDGQQWTENFAPETEQQQPTTSDADASGFDLDATVLREDIQSTAEEPGIQASDESPTQVYPPSDYTTPGYAPPAAPGYADLNATAAYPGAYQAPAATGPKKTPVLGFIGFGLAVLGTILACIPVTVFFGMFVLFAAFVVSIIAIFQKNTKKWPSITGLILSIVGGIIAAVVAVLAFLFIVGDAVSDLPSSAPSADSEGVVPDESDEPSVETGEGRPSAEEVSTGFREIIATMGMTDELSDEQISCYADYFVASDIPDETLWVIASGDETLSNVDAATEFTDKLTEGMSTCLIP